MLQALRCGVHPKVPLLAVGVHVRQLSQRRKVRGKQSKDPRSDQVLRHRPCNRHPICNIHAHIIVRYTMRAQNMQLDSGKHVHLNLLTLAELVRPLLCER